jgi:hypothetical protein
VVVEAAAVLAVDPGEAAGVADVPLRGAGTQRIGERGSVDVLDDGEDERFVLE